MKSLLLSSSLLLGLIGTTFAAIGDVCPSPSASGTVGQGLDTSVLPCSGGAFQAGLCPGPDNVQCCLPTAQTPPPAPSPTPKPQPPAPSCPSFMIIPDDIVPFLDDIVFSREATK